MGSEKYLCSEIYECIPRVLDSIVDDPSAEIRIQLRVDGYPCSAGDPNNYGLFWVVCFSPRPYRVLNKPSDMREYFSDVTNALESAYTGNIRLSETQESPCNTIKCYRWSCYQVNKIPDRILQLQPMRCTH